VETKQAGNHREEILVGALSSALGSFECEVSSWPVQKPAFESKTNMPGEGGAGHVIALATGEEAIT
jgi:hypothetical protein